MAGHYNDTDNRATPFEENYFNFLWTGLREGGIFNINAGDPAKFDYTTGRWQIGDSDTNTLFRVNWDADTAVTLDNLATEPQTFVWFDTNGNLVQISPIASSEESRDNIIVGFIFHPNNVDIQDVINIPRVTTLDIPACIADASIALWIVNRTGNNIFPNASDLQVRQSAWTLFISNANFHTNRKNPNFRTSSQVSPLAFTYEFIGDTDIVDQPGTLFINPANYDAFTGGTTVPNGVVGATEYSIQRCYIANNQTVFIQYWQVLYDNMDNAINSVQWENFFPFNLGVHLITSIVLRGDATDLSDTDQAVFVRHDRFGNNPTFNSSALTRTYNALKETITPTAETGVGKVYTKSDNNLYFQDWAWEENVILAKKPEQDLTISSWAITVTESPIIYAIIDTEGWASTDDLDQINWGSTGDLIIFQTTDSARDIRVRNLVWNINMRTPVNQTLFVPADKMMFIKASSWNWDELSRSINDT